MTVQLRSNANIIADQLLNTEAAIDAAIAAVSALTSAIPTATRDAAVAPHFTHEALVLALESCQQLVKSRTNILRTHKSLSNAQQRLGLAETGIMQCVGQPNAETKVRHLSVVAA